MTTLEKLKKIIQKANSEIMDLEFGCEIMMIDAENEWAKYPIKIGSSEINSYGVKMFYTEILMEGKVVNRTTNENDVNSCKILGRHITLCDVLITLGKVNKNSLAYIEKEWELKHFLAHNVLKIVGDWNKNKNNLDDQEPELWDWLYDLLK